MAHSLEVREPLMDHKLVEWLATLPSSMKVRGQEGKFLLKKAMEPQLPDEVLVPPEDGLRVPLAQWFRGPLKQRVRDAVLGRAAGVHGLVQPALPGAPGQCTPERRQRLQLAAVDAVDVRGLPAQVVDGVPARRRTPMAETRRSAGMTLRVLHVLDHSIPLHSGYTFRTLAILREQRRLGWETFHLTSPKHSASDGPEETVDGWHFYRTPAPGGPQAARPGRDGADEGHAATPAGGGASACGRTSSTPIRRCSTPCPHCASGANWASRGLRGACLLGGRRGRPRHHRRRQPALPADAAPGNARAAPGGARLHHLRRPAPATSPRAASRRAR